MTRSRIRIGYLFTLGFIALITLSCSGIRRREAAHVQTGLASWYGPNFHGKATSNREVYNMYDMTAAHRTLPFGTYVMVTNMDNSRSVMVKINDRGPFVEGRIIDLSYAAAQVLDAIDPGVIPVKIEVLADLSPPISTQRYAVQVGSFVKKDNARSLQKKLKKTYKDIYVSLFKTPTQTYYRVRIKAAERHEAESIARKLSSEGYVSFVIEEL
jgi:rare lipoprotein A